MIKSLGYVGFLELGSKLIVLNRNMNSRQDVKYPMSNVAHLD